MNDLAVPGWTDNLAMSRRLGDRPPPPTALIAWTRPSLGRSDRREPRRPGAAIDCDGALAVWDAALAAEWSCHDVSVHGDVTGSNSLITDDRLSAVIDFGCSVVGDAECDLTPAWTMFEGSSRRRFIDALGYDDSAWARARG